MTHVLELHESDCLPILRNMKSKSIDLLLTDPPYGISIAKRGKIGNGRQFTPKNWDAAVPTRALFHEMLRVARKHIIWGGNYFTFALPPSKGWLVWWKNDGLPCHQFADCELAWTSFDTPAQVFNSRWRGFVRDSQETRYLHPTQKALEVMKWCVSSFSQPSDTILDPFMGSGTTGVAAMLLQRKFIGIEMDAEYSAIAKHRIYRSMHGQI